MRSLASLGTRLIIRFETWGKKSLASLQLYPQMQCSGVAEIDKGHALGALAVGAENTLGGNIFGMMAKDLYSVCE